jgi:hypothetical protein
VPIRDSALCCCYCPGEFGLQNQGEAGRRKDALSSQAAQGPATCSFARYFRPGLSLASATIPAVSVPFRPLVPASASTLRSRLEPRARTGDEEPDPSPSLLAHAVIRRFDFVRRIWPFACDAVVGSMLSRNSSRDLAGNAPVAKIGAPFPAFLSPDSAGVVPSRPERFTQEPVRIALPTKPTPRSLPSFLPSSSLHPSFVPPLAQP